jgi:hypothetical protein
LPDPATQADRIVQALRWLPQDGAERNGADRATGVALRVARGRGWAERRYRANSAYPYWRLTHAGRAWLAGDSANTTAGPPPPRAPNSHLLEGGI